MTMLALAKIRLVDNYKPQVGYGVSMPRKDDRDNTHDDRFDEAYGERLMRGLTDKATILPQSQIQEIAVAAADTAIHKMWIQFGVDLTKDDSVRAINEDFIELRRRRLAREKWAWLFRGAMVTALCTGSMGAIAWTVKTVISIIQPSHTPEH